MIHTIRKNCLGSLVALMALLPATAWADAGQEPVDYVNPFVGTTNYGTTNPGALCPQGMMSVVPFNVMGAVDGNRDKDSRWWSTPYEYKNTYFTGYAHVNLSLARSC